MGASEHTKTIIDFICDTNYEDIPAVAVENAKGRILDTIGVAFKGGTESVGLVLILIKIRCGLIQKIYSFWVIVQNI